MAGYSGTPLAQKLGIKAGAKVHLIDAPKNYRALVAPLPEGIQFVPRMSAEVSLAHLFTTQKARFAKTLRLLKKSLKPDGVIWVSWPKKASKVVTDITEDTLREVALPLGLVDIKVCAVDETWSGLKLVIRKALRSG